MRNDALDELDRVPSLRPDAADRDDAPPEYRPSARTPAPSGRAASGVLWALVVALSIALGGLGWWSHQQIALMEAQLVATQESFVRISEEAAGRIQDINGKVIAAESNVTTGSEALRLQVRQLQKRLDELGSAQQQSGSRSEDLQSRLGKLDSAQGEQRQAFDALSEQLKGLAALDTGLQAARKEQAQLAERVEALAGVQKSQEALSARLDETRKQVQALQAEDSSAAIRSVQQDLLVLRTELENRPAPSQGASTAEFDAFRAQVTRNINALQSQVQSLSQRVGQ